MRRKPFSPAEVRDIRTRHERFGLTAAFLADLYRVERKEILQVLRGSYEREARRQYQRDYRKRVKRRMNRIANEYERQEAKRLPREELGWLTS
jgi:hypothetical protein